MNLEQNKVNSSLAYDLFELARSRSPYKTCHNIAVALDRSKDGPFFERIKRLGVATEGRTGELLTQSTVVNSLIRYISDDPKGDRDVILKGKKLQEVTGEEAKRLCFRTLFIDNEDLKIGKIVEEYFKAVRSRWPEAWAYRGPGRMLNRTNGFRALMRILGRAYQKLAEPGGLVAADAFKMLFDRVTVDGEGYEVDSNYFTVERFRPGTAGEAALRTFLEERMF